MKDVIFFLSLLIIFLFFSQAQADKIRPPLHLTLKSALKMAQIQNAQVIAANEHVRQALAAMSSSRAALLPQVSGIFGGQRQTSDMRASGIKLPGNPHIGPFNSFDARGQLTMEIFDPAAMRRLESARASQKLSQAEFLKVRQDVLALVAAMFLEADRAHQSVELIKVNFHQMQHRYNIIKTRYVQGTASASELDKASADMAQAQYLLSVYRTHAEQTKLDLASALKIPLDQPIIFEEDKWQGPNNTTASLSPEVVLAQAQLLQSQADEKVVRASFLPSVTASGDYGRSGESPKASSGTYSFGLGISVPIWEGGLKQAQLQQVKSKVKENEVLLADTKDHNQVKIKEGQDLLQEAGWLLNAKQQQFRYALHQEEVVVHRLKLGLGSVQEMDEVESIKAFALDERNEAQAVYWTAQINLAHTLGRIDNLFDLK